jgi:hypothetical protein
MLKLQDVASVYSMEAFRMEDPGFHLFSRTSSYGHRYQLTRWTESNDIKFLQTGENRQLALGFPKCN